MVEKIKQQNLLKLPNLTLKRVGLHPGDCVEVTDDGYHIILTPIEEEFTEEEWKKILSLKKEKGKTFRSGKALIKHLNRLTQK